MQYDFLKNFPRRMKNVGIYALLIQNSIQKGTWKQAGFLTLDDQLNLLFSVLLFIMEQSLKEVNCTMDDIGVFIDTINVQYWKRELSYEECHRLGDFIVNVILSNEGRVMYFSGLDYEENEMQTLHVNYVANKVVYLENDLKRTSYYLTDDGYSLLLSTLEVENNMKLSIHEMIFQMHLEKQSYDKAVDEIKNVFNLMRIQLQKILEAMGKIRRNALSYSVKDYEEILVENLETIGETKKKFVHYKEMVAGRVREMEEDNINLKRLDKKEEEQLRYLKTIESYLNRTIDEHQKILGGHFDLKSLYTKELEDLAQMSWISRFSLGTDLYEKLLENPEALDRLDYFLRPLFNQDVNKTYNLNKVYQLQKPMRKRQELSSIDAIDFDEEKWQEEKERQRQIKLKKYRDSLNVIFQPLVEKGNITLGEVVEMVTDDLSLKDTLIPSLDVFKEIMVDLIKGQEFHIESLQKERSEFFQDKGDDFQLNDLLLQLVEEAADRKNGRRIEKILVRKNQDEKPVIFEDVMGEDGARKDIRCSNVSIKII